MNRFAVLSLATTLLLAAGSRRAEESAVKPASTTPAPASSEPVATAEQPTAGEPIRLFNGKDFDGWKFYGRLNRKKWAVGAATPNPEKKQTLKAEPGGGDLVNSDIVGSDLVTTAGFRDFLLEFEFMLPPEGNSGVYLLGQYELQISHEPDADPDMAIGSIPRLLAPKTIVPIEPGRWHHYSIDFRAPRFDEAGRKVENARLVRVSIDGVSVHEDAQIPGPTVGAIKDNAEVPEGPIMLQGSHTSVAFRNIVLTPRP